MNALSIATAIIPLLRELLKVGVDLRTLADKIQTADEEGRDPTPEEIEAARTSARDAIDRV